jgi:hypothetical protein
MYLDPQEQEDVDHTITVYYQARLAHVFLRSGLIFSWIILAALVVFFGGLCVTPWALPLSAPVWVHGTPSVAMIVALRGGRYWVRQRLRQVPTGERITERLEEIRTAALYGHDRALFLRLITALRTGSATDMQDAAEDAASSATVSQLTFVQEVQAGLRDMLGARQ